MLDATVVLGIDCTTAVDSHASKAVMPKRKKEKCVTSASRPSSPPPPVLPATIAPRRVLPDFCTLDQLLDLLRTCKRIVVVTGAGIRQALVAAYVQGFELDYHSQYHKYALLVVYYSFF